MVYSRSDDPGGTGLYCQYRRDYRDNNCCEIEEKDGDSDGR